jgi:hypothetical protein
MSETEPPRPVDPGFVPTPAQPEFKRGRQYTLEIDFAALFAGKVVLPNFEPIAHWEALRASMGYGRTVEEYQPEGKTFKQHTTARLPGSVLDPATYWQDPAGRPSGRAIYHLNCGQGGGLTGEGVVVVDVAGLVKYRAIPESIIAGRFTFCKHEKVEGAGANHSRGWHPGYCDKCGLDMSVDSGD